MHGLHASSMVQVGPFKPSVAHHQGAMQDMPGQAVLCRDLLALIAACRLGRICSALSCCAHLTAVVHEWPAVSSLVPAHQF
jgi:hypothetical protein